MCTSAPKPKAPPKPPPPAPPVVDKPADIKVGTEDQEDRKRKATSRKKLSVNTTANAPNRSGLGTK